MIPFDEIDNRLDALGKDRAWLAAAAGRKPSSIGDALAPNAKPSKRSALLQKAITEAIEREEERQRATIVQPQIQLPDRISVEATLEERRSWERAALAKRLTTEEWAIAALNEAAMRHAAATPPLTALEANTEPQSENRTA